MPLQDQLIRGCKPGPELRAAEDGGMPKLTGYPIRFNEWTTIHSLTEGHFREMVTPGAVTRTLKENKPKIIFNHGDSQIGEMPIAPSALIADERGVRYDEPELYDEPFTRGLIPRLRDGELGSSFKFNVTREDWDESPKPSEENPDGIPERKVTEMRLFETGPVVWPAYESATAGVRSLTDAFRRYTLAEMEELFERWAKDPERFKALAGVLGAEVTSGEDRAVSDEPWGNFADSDYSDAQYEKACVLDRKACGGEWADKPPKTRCSLRILEPDGELNRNGVHAAAARFNQTEACTEAKNAAKAKLRAAYGQLGEEVPEALRSESPSDDRGSSSDMHSPGAEKPSHSTGRRRKKDQTLYGVKANQPTWRLPTKE